MEKERMEYTEYDITVFTNILGIAPSTVSKWSNDYDIKIKKDTNNKRVFTDYELGIFKRIQELKEQNWNIHDIRNALKIEFDVGEEEKEENLPATKGTLQEFWNKLEERDAIRDERIINIINSKADTENYLVKALADVQAENERLKKELEESKKGFFKRLFNK